MSEGFQPVIIGFTCNWCSYRAADLAGTARVKYSPNVRLIRLMCSGRLDPTFDPGDEVVEGLLAHLTLEPTVAAHRTARCTSRCDVPAASVRRR